MIYLIAGCFEKLSYLVFFTVVFSEIYIQAYKREGEGRGKDEIKPSCNNYIIIILFWSCPIDNILLLNAQFDVTISELWHH